MYMNGKCDFENGADINAGLTENTGRENNGQNAKHALHFSAPPPKD